AAVEAGCNSIRLEITCPTLGRESVRLRFDEQSGWLLVGVDRTGWLPRLTAEQSSALTLALVGFYKEGGVDLGRGQIEASFAPSCPPYDVTEAGLVVWPGGDFATEVVYDLREGPVLRPRVVAEEPSNGLPVLKADELLVRNREITWTDWVEAWDR